MSSGQPATVRVRIADLSVDPRLALAAAAVVASPGGMVSFLYGSREHPSALFTQFAATVDDVIFKKVASDTTIRAVSVGGQPGYWLEGAHFFSYFDRDQNMETEPVRLAGNVLLWEVGSRTLRLEADVSEAEALRIARSAE